MAQFKPMLAAKYDEDHYLNFPLLVSAKIDGIRAMVQNGKLVTRKLKLVPNLYLQNKWGRPQYEGIDGEICMGPANISGLFNRTQSAVMSRDGEPECDWHVFDIYGYLVSFETRISILKTKLIDLNSSLNRVSFVPHSFANSMKELNDFEETAIANGYEGVMLRDPRGYYKQGRSTLREGGLIKVKRFEDDEAEVISVFEQMENTNEQKTNELGRSKRSSHKAGMVGKNTLGGFTCRSHHFTQTFNIGTGLGLTQELRQELWSKRWDLPGRIVKFKFQRCGMKDVPRMPVWLGFRDQGE